MKFQLFLACLLTTIAAGSPALAAAEEPVPPFAGVVTADRVNVRAGGNENYEILTQLNRGDKVVVLSREIGWHKIKIPDACALFVNEQFVRPGPDGFLINGKNVNVRVGAALDYNVIGQLNSGDRIEVMGREKDWYRIHPPAGFAAWMKSDYVKYYSGVEQYEREERERKEIREEFARLGAAADAELGKPAGDAGLSPLLEKYQDFVNLHPREPEAEGARSRIKELRLQRAEQELIRARRKVEEKLAELNRPADETGVPPVASGKIEDLGMIINRPATHKLTADGKTIYYLKSDSCDLNRFVYYRVAVWGKIMNEPPAKHPLILVEKVKVIE